MNPLRSSTSTMHSGLWPNEVIQGPTPEEWERMKDRIYRIYIIEGNPLKTLIPRMETEHSFRATEKMYNTYFKKWRPLFNKNKRPNAGSANKQGIRIPRTRPRRLQSHPKDSSTHRSKRCIRPYSFCGPQLSDGYTKQMVVMNLTEVYVYGLFDTFNFSSSPFDIIVPFGTPDHSLVWQQTSDECFGATTLMLKDNFVKGFRTFSILCE